MQANTHVNVQHELKDVKLWQVTITCHFGSGMLSFISSLSFGTELIVFVLNYQVHTLLKGLEKIAASADIPMLVCGDFNSMPGRSVVFNSF